MRIGKQKLAERLARQTGTPQRDIEKILDALDHSIRDALYHGDSVVLPGLMSLNLAGVPERSRYNPATGEKIVVPAKRVVRCRISDVFQKSLHSSYVPRVVVGWVNNLDELSILQGGVVRLGCVCSVRPVLNAAEIEGADAAIVGPDCSDEDLDVFLEELAVSKHNQLVIRFVRAFPKKLEKPFRYLPWKTFQMPANADEAQRAFETRIKPDIWSCGNYRFWCRVAIRSEIVNVTRLHDYLELFLPRVIRKSSVPDVLNGILEAVDNAIQHGNNSRSELEVQLTMLVTRDRLYVQVKDDGKGFDFNKYLAMLQKKRSDEIVKSRRPDQRPGGLGIPLMMQVFDVVSYEGDGNLVTMEKKLKATIRQSEERQSAGSHELAAEEEGAVKSPETEIEEMQESEVTDSFITTGKARA